MEKSIWYNSVRNEEVIYTDKYEGKVMHTLKRRKSSGLVTSAVENAF